MRHDKTGWDTIGWEKTRWDMIEREKTQWDTIGWKNTRWDSIGWEMTRWYKIGWKVTKSSMSLKKVFLYVVSESPPHPKITNTIQTEMLIRKHLFVWFPNVLQVSGCNAFSLFPDLLMCVLLFFYFKNILTQIIKFWMHGLYFVTTIFTWWQNQCLWRNLQIKHTRRWL